MDRTYEAGAAANPPSPPATPSTGYPFNGDPATGQAATQPGAWWFHMITEEIRGVIAAAGITPDHTQVNQLLAALQAGFGLGLSKTNAGYVTLPGGIILQWGHVTVSDMTLVTFPLAFPNACFVVVCGDGTQTANPIKSITAVGVAQDSVTTTSFKARSNQNTSYFWMAIGH